MARRKSRSVSQSSQNTWQTVYMDLITIVMVFFLVLSLTTEVGRAEKSGDYSVLSVNADDSYFDPGKASLTQKARRTITKLVSLEDGLPLGLNPKKGTRSMVVIHGHTDDVGNRVANFHLGYRRALSVYQELVRHKPQYASEVSICTHADNLPRVAVPSPPSADIPQEAAAEIRAKMSNARARNRRVKLEMRTNIEPVQSEEELWNAL